MKAFFLRELAFVMAPLSLILSPGKALGRIFWFGLGVIGTGLALGWALAIFVLKPAWYEWIGIFILLFLAWLSSRFGIGLSGGK